MFEKQIKRCHDKMVIHKVEKCPYFHENLKCSYNSKIQFGRFIDCIKKEMSFNDLKNW